MSAGATNKRAQHLVKWVPGVHGRHAVRLVVWASNPTLEVFCTMVMADVNGIMKSNHATTWIAKFHALTLSSLSGRNVLSLVSLLRIVLRIV